MTRINPDYEPKEEKGGCKIKKVHPAPPIIDKGMQFARNSCERSCASKIKWSADVEIVVSYPPDSRAPLHHSNEHHTTGMAREIDKMLVFDVK